MPTIAGLRQRQQRQGGSRLNPQQSLARQQSNLLARGLAVDPENEGLARLAQRFGDDLDLEQLQELGVNLEDIGVDIESGGEGGGGILGTVGGIINSIPGAPQALDILGRPGQAILQTVDNLREGDNPIEGLYGGLSGRGEEVTATDAILGEGRGPGGVLGGVLDFAGGVATDPTSYLTFGTSGAARATLSALARESGEEGLQTAAQAIARQGLRRAERSGLANSDDIARHLTERATEAGVRNVDRTVGRQMRNLSRSGGGGLRFAGVNTGIGTGRAQLMRRGSALDVAGPSRLGSTRAGEFARNAFRTGNATRGRFGDLVAGDVQQALSGGHAVAERAANEWAPTLQQISQEVPNMQALDPEIRTALLQATDATAEQASRAAGRATLADAAVNVDTPTLFDDVAATAPAAVRPEVQAAVTGLRNVYEGMADAGRQIGYDVPPMRALIEGADAGDTAADTVLKLATRMAASSGMQRTLKNLDTLTDNLGQRLIFDETSYRALPAAQRAGVKLVEEGNLRLYVPEEIVEDVRRHMDYLSTDKGMRELTGALNRANSLWKAYATVLPTGGGFFSRNGLGGTINNAIAGMDPRWAWRTAKTQAAKRFGLGSKSAAIPDQWWQWAVDDGVAESGFIFQEASSSLANIRKATHKGKPRLGRGRIGRAAQQINPTNIENAPLRLGRGINTGLENNMRLSLYFDGLDKGMTRSAAAQRVKKYHFDYTDLTAVEREKLKPWIAFYTFMRNNLALQGDMLITKPGVITGQAHGIEAAQANLQDGTPSLFPTYPFAGGAAVATPGAIYSADLPLTSAAEQVGMGFNALQDLVLKRDPQAAFRFILNQTGGIRPALAESLSEVVLERDLFTGQDLDTLSERNQQVIGALFPGVTKTRRAIEQTGSLTRGERAQLLPFFLGIGYTPINSDTQLGEMYRRLDTIEAYIEGMGEVPTIEELRTLGLIPSSGGGGSRFGNLAQRLGN